MDGRTFRNGRKSPLREAVKALLNQCGASGIEFSELEQRFGAVDRTRLTKLLANMRQCGDAHFRRPKPGCAAVWYAGSDETNAAAPDVLSPMEWRRQQRARLADKRSPIVFYGQRLKGGRCASVWEYARHMQAAAGVRA